MNTALPTGDEPLTDAFLQWQDFAASHPDLIVSKIIARGLTHPERISGEELAGYDAPFPDASYKAGAAGWPALVPGKPGDPGAAEMRRARENLRHWPRPALVMFSDGDPVTAGWDRIFLDTLPTARDFGPVVIEGAGHFLQEEKGDEIAEHILRFMAATPLAQDR
jgi:haloalkane dehalogenase